MVASHTYNISVINYLLESFAAAYVEHAYDVPCLPAQDSMGMHMCR